MFRSHLLFCLAATLATAGCWKSPPARPPAATPPAPPATARPTPPPAEPVAEVAPAEEPAAAPSTDELAAAEAASNTEPTEPPAEPPQRLLLLTSGGPLVVEVVITVDGGPLRAARKRLVDELLKMADSDNDGSATWEEAFKHPRFGALETAISTPENDRERQRQRKSYDRNADGLVDRSEAERFMAQVAGAGSSLILESTSYRGQMTDSSRLRELIDADGDRALSQAEWQAAPGRLKLYDVDDNDLITLQELSGMAPAGAMEMTRPQTRDVGGPARALLLGMHANWPSIMYSFQDLYLHDGQLQRESFPLCPQLFEHLDLDDSGLLERREFERLNTAPAQARIEVHFGRTGDLSKQPKVEWIDPALAAELSPGGASLQLEGLKLQLAATDTTPSTDFDMAAQQALEQLDGDKNGYLDPEEYDKAEAPQRPEAAFADVDVDADGKLYKAEIVSYLEKQQPPSTARVQLTVADLDDPFYWVLDKSGDGRLSPRELHTAHATMQTLDADSDGQLTREEIPALVSLTFERGERNAANMPQPVRMAQPPPAAESRGPGWFVAMDRNGDQDVSRGEFLGTVEQFQQLDHNRDGFLEADEALSASAGR